MDRVSILIISTLFTLPVFAQHNTYYVGHSGFGWDLIVGEMVNDLAADANITTYDYGFQFIGGTCISNQWMSHADPQGGTDSHVELATGNYDMLVLAEQIPIQEVINGSPWGCDLTSVESIDNYYDLALGANPTTRVYLMEFHNEVDLTQNDPYGSWISLNAQMRPLWEQVVNDVNSNNSGSEIHIVPVAAAFQEMAERVRAGTFPGISDWQELFDPNDEPQATIHPTEITYYMVACVHFATLFGQSPVGLTNETIAAAGWPFDPPTPDQALVMQEIAWNVVSNDDFSGVNTTVTNLPESYNPRSKMHVKVSPNPIYNRYSIDFLGKDLNNASIFITNLSGQTVFSYDGIDGSDINLERGSLPNGMYIYTIWQETNLIAKGKLSFK